jgi:hypothetical protein
MENIFKMRRKEYNWSPSEDDAIKKFYPDFEKITAETGRNSICGTKKSRFITGLTLRVILMAKAA